MFAHAYGYSSCLWETFYSHEWESIPWSTSRQSSFWPTGTVCPQHMVFPSRGRATAGTEQQGTRSCPGSGSRRIHSKTLLQETKRESIASMNHICVLLRPQMPSPATFLQIYSKCIQVELSLTEGETSQECITSVCCFSPYWTTGRLVESTWFT